MTLITCVLMMSHATIPWAVTNAVETVVSLVMDSSVMILTNAKSPVSSRSVQTKPLP